MKAARASSPTISRTPAYAVLEIEVEHKFAEAHLSIWVDDLLTYTHPLAGADKKHLVVFHHVQGNEFHAVQISPGNHRLRSEEASGGALTLPSPTVYADFPPRRATPLRTPFPKPPP